MLKIKKRELTYNNPNNGDEDGEGRSSPMAKEDIPKPAATIVIHEEKMLRLEG